MANTKTKAVVALGVLDIVRQVATAWSARQQAERDRIGFGAGLKQDVASVARDTRDRVSDHMPDRLVWGMPPWRREPTTAERLRAWWPVAVIVAASSIALVLTARFVARHEPNADADELAADSRIVGAIRSGSEAIDSGVTKVVEGGSAAAVGTASAVAAGSSAVKSAVVDRVKHEVDDRVVTPAKRKGIRIGILALLGLTAYVVVIAALVQLAVAAFT